MNKYTVFSFATLVIFIVLFYTIWSGVSLGTLGKILIISMFLFLLLGTFLGLKAKKDLIKWILIILNIIAVCIIGYILLLAYSIAER
ncbi:hypothetical protein [Bacillus cereus]|uniref:hypothetical protein n=1 Tax=Bacillus nitratireducens TaxID=2026193 RepID=UPI000BFDCA4D|nr:hypothetical protein COD66_21865 [Bacillus cereus]